MQKMAKLVLGESRCFLADIKLIGQKLNIVKVIDSQNKTQRYKLQVTAKT